MPVLNLDGLRVSYSDAGNGIAVVFIPGLGGSKEWFRYQSSGLSDHYRVISYDLRRARANKPSISFVHPDHNDYSLDLLVEDLAKFLTSIRVHVAVIAGHSLGGLIALQFALSHPDRCLMLLLCSTAPSFGNQTDDELISDMLPGGICRDGAMAKLWKKLVGAKPREIDDSDPLAHIKRFSPDTDCASVDARVRILRETDMTPALSNVAVPSLIVAGSEERPYILSGSQVLEQELSNSSLEIIEGSDQFYFYTRHDQFNALITDYLSHKITRL